jgi:hypothetical protein
MKKAATKKSDKANLAAGAEEIRKAQKELKEKNITIPKAGPIVIPESTRPIEDIVRDRVTMLPGHIGLKLADDTPIEESLRVLDWTTTLSDHVGFMIGDVLNFGNTKWGEKYTQALNQTGRALPTLKQYASVSARIPIEKRQAVLTYTHHREILAIGDEQKIATVLKEVAKQAESGHAPTTREIAEKVRKLTPRKVKTPKRVTSGKGKKKKAEPEPPPYEPSADEQSKLDFTEDKAKKLAQAIKDGGVFKIAAKLDNIEKRR